MAIRNWTGLPGTGKTYRVVYELVRKREWADNYFVVHNIDGLKNDAVSSDGCCRSVEEIRLRMGWGADIDFWTRPVQEELAGVVRAQYKKPVLMVVDEAQQLFGRRGLDNARLEWLTYHRHLGQQVWLISQTAELLSRDVVDLVEVEVRARRGVVTSAFVYQWLVGGRGFRFDRLKTDPAVYAAYTSAQEHTSSGVRTHLVALAVGGIALAACGVSAYAKSLGSGHRAAVAAASRAGAAARVPAAPSTGPGGPGVPVVPGPVAAGPVSRRPAWEPPSVRVVARPAVVPAASAAVVPAVPVDTGPVPVGWVYVGVVRGRPCVWDGADLRPAASLVRPGWRVVAHDGRGRRLVCVHPERGPGYVEHRLIEGSGLWFEEST